MYCRHCGSEIDDRAVVCVHCGCDPFDDDKYCNNCGAKTTPEMSVCMNCGVPVSSRPANHSGSRKSYTKTSSSATTGTKSKAVAGSLAVLTGAFGIHNFYLGNTEKAKKQLLLGALGMITGIGPSLSAIWGLADAVKIFSDKETDGDGNSLTD